MPDHSVVNPAAEGEPVGVLIRRARRERGLTQKELAQRIGVTQSLVAKVENGWVQRGQVILMLMLQLDLPLERLVARGRRPRWEFVVIPPPAAPSPPEPLDKRDPKREVPRLAADRARLDRDYEYFARQRLRIRSKRGAIDPLVFNCAQAHIHAALEAQRAATGKVRALILKGRQQGCSTYVAGRYYHRASRNRGLRVFILTHEEQATRNLFEMVQRFHDNCEDRPSTSVANAEEFRFDAIDSGYKVGTAGNRGVGRSSTLQLFHGSEVAFWPHADTHAAGVLQAVADEPGTEIILESTANGVGNLFHKMWRDAETGASDYIAIFVPWYWQEEYRRTLEFDLVLDAEERGYAMLYHLDDEQMAWRRSKIAELGDASLFRQEYPASAAEAFQMTGHDSFIPPALIERARKATCAASGPLVIGYDPAWTGGDRHAMAWRRGRCLVKVETRSRLDTVAAAGWLKQVIDADRPVKVFVDVGGVGAGVYDQLVHMGAPYSAVVEAVNFGSAPFEPAPLDEQGRPSGGPLNRRAEIWLKSREWLEDAAGVQIPDCDALQADACGPGYRFDAHTRIVLERKEDMRRRGALSPDQWDAVALTFAKPVAPSWFSRRLEYSDLGIV